MDFFTLLLLSALCLIVAYYYCFKDLDYFRKHRILYIPPLPILGNMWPMFFQRASLAELIQKIYNLNQDAKYVGFFEIMNPVLVIRDPQLIKSIAITNFGAFPDHRGFFDPDNVLLIGKNLFSLRGEEWRDARVLLSPMFTSNKMKTMFQLISKCAADFADFLSKLPSNERIVEMKKYYTKYASNTIAACAYGIKIDSLKNPDNEFYVYGNEASVFDVKRLIKFYLLKHIPLAKYLGIEFVSGRVGHFFKNIVEETIRVRDTQNIARPDMLQLMMDSRGKRGPGKELTLEDMTSHAFVFFFGGYDTISSTMCFVAHEITVNPDVQEKLRDEIDEVLGTTNGTFTYEAVIKMQYLDAVIRETLRLYPSVPFIDRICAKDFVLPPALPGGDPFVVRKGMNIWFPAYGIQRDPKYFSEPDVFRPERFVGKNADAMNPNAYIPFGLGPRMCIGTRFALLNIKVMLCHLLARCELKPCARTPNPMRMCKTSFFPLAEDGFWMEIRARRDGAISSRS